MWHHEHIFEPKDSGVLMTDRISYKLPMGILGRLAHSVFVRKKLRRIFEFREITLNQLFN
jgi:ligand-binding SRPBCC domain-containing protein